MSRIQLFNVMQNTKLPLSKIVEKDIKMVNEARVQLGFLIDTVTNPEWKVKVSKDGTLTATSKGHNLIAERCDATDEFAVISVDGKMKRVYVEFCHDLVAFYTDEEFYGVYNAPGYIKVRR